MRKSTQLTLIPVMFCFFAMGFVDLVGIASNYVKADLNLTDSAANVFPSLVFFWFLIFAVPTGMLMNKIGRKKTVLVSLVITVASLLLPLFGNSYELMLISFSLLGIGNAFMQTSLNPLISNIISGDRFAATLTFGQFVKAIASFMAPIIAAWGAAASIPHFGLGWRILFPIYMVIGILATLMLSATPIVLLSFIGIMCHVGIDVGTNTHAPKILQERLHMGLDEAGFATSLYFIFRTLGCLSGSFILAKFNNRAFFYVSVVMMALSMLGLAVGESKAVLYTAIALVGFGNSNIFSLVFSQAVLSLPDKKNEVSGLMIMGLFGGTIFPLLMGPASDAVGQWGAAVVMAFGVVYLFTYGRKIGAK